jgi:hypothetical protein
MLEMDLGSPQDFTLDGLKVLASKSPVIVTLGYCTNFLTESLDLGDWTDDCRADISTLARVLTQFPALTLLNISCSPVEFGKASFSGFVDGSDIYRFVATRGFQHLVDAIMEGGLECRIKQISLIVGHQFVEDEDLSWEWADNNTVIF